MLIVENRLLVEKNEARHALRVNGVWACRHISIGRPKMKEMVYWSEVFFNR